MNKESTVYISLGSNMGDSANVITTAVENINAEIGSVSQLSSFYETEPWGFSAEQNFVNAMLAIKTKFNAEEVMNALLNIEERMGRVRNKSEIYESRPIDLDVIAIDNEVIETKGLIVPHPKMHLRAFVLIPFFEIEPEWQHPLINKGLQALIADLKDSQKVKRLNV